MKKAGFCESKFRSMLLTGTLTMAVIYIMLLCDNIIAGRFIGEAGVAAINAITPVTGVVTFASTIVSIGSGILYSREIGAMDKKRADQIYGQGLVLSLLISVVSAVLLMAGKDVYFEANGVTGEIRELAEAYFLWTPLNSALTVLFSYVSQMVYTDGDETINNVSYGLQIVGNIAVSIVLVQSIGMEGIIIGTIAGNVIGFAACIPHYFKKSNTLHFVWHLSGKDLLKIMRFSIVDASIYLCWAVMDYVLIAHVSANYGDKGLVTLALVVSVLEFSVVMDGVGMAVQPLLGVYLGEKNNTMIKRLMRDSVKAAVIEGIIASVIVFVFAKQFCQLFNVSEIGDAVLAVRVVSVSMIFCSLVSLTTSYYMLVDHIGLSTAITFLKDGLLYSLLPVIASVLWGKTAMWAAFVISPLAALVLSFLYIRLRYGKEMFPYLLHASGKEIVIFEDVLTADNCALLSSRVSDCVTEYGYSRTIANRAALFVEEIGLTVIEKNGKTKKPLLVEISLFFEGDTLALIERDSGEVFDVTDPNLKIDGLSSFVLNGLIQAHKDKAYITTTGYNRNMIRFGTTQLGFTKEDYKS